MRSFKLFITLFLSIVASLSSAQQVSFRGEAPGAVISGEKFRLTYTINKDGSDFRLPTLENFQILMGPSTSQSTSMVIDEKGNMQRTSEFSFTYILKCETPGRYSISPATILVDGKKIESNSLTVEVIKGESGQTQQSNQGNSQDASVTSKDDLFITVTANKSSVYKDQPVELTTKLYVRPQINVQGISDQKLPDLKAFISQDLESNKEQQYETVNGVTYVTLIISQKLVFPQQTGKITIDPTEIEFIVKQRATRRSQSVFDDFFESSYRTVKSRVSSKALTLDVKSLPTPVPSDFSGIVGDVKMSATASKNKVKTNDGITITLIVSGTGNHKLMSTPDLQVPADFDKFDPKITNNFTNSVSGMAGSKTIEYLVIPRHSGNYTIPPITLSYFDIDTKKYKQLASSPIVIDVEKGSSEESTTTSAGAQYSASREEIKYLGKDIRYIMTKADRFRPVGSFYLGSGLFYTLLILPLIAFGVFIFMVRKQIKESSNIQLSKHKRANKVALKRLKVAHELLLKNNKEAFYDEVLRALWGYMSDKLSLPVAKLSKDNAASLMKGFMVPDDTISKFMEILDTCEFARYAPASGSAEMDKLYQETVNTITLLEDQIKK